MSKLLFLDLETTGLDPERDHILEFGWILYDIVEEKDYMSYSRLFDRNARFARMDRVVREMHEKNGLLEACERGEGAFCDPGDAELDTLHALRAHGLKAGEVQLAGFSVHFDKRFLERHMPLLHAYLHHRIVDVSTLRTLSKIWTGQVREKGDQHRVILDCLDAIAELREYRKLFPVPAIVESVG